MNKARAEGCIEAQTYMINHEQRLNDEINGTHAYERGRYYYEKADFQSAFVEFNKAVMQNPRNGWHYYYRGLIKKRLQDFQGALFDFESAIGAGVEKAREDLKILKLQMNERQRKFTDIYDTSDKFNAALVSFNQAIKDKKLDDRTINQRFQEMEKDAIKYRNPEFFHMRANYYNQLALHENDNATKVDYFNKATSDYRHEVSIYSSFSLNKESDKSSLEKVKEDTPQHVRFFSDANQSRATNKLVSPKELTRKNVEKDNEGLKIKF